MTLEWRGEPRSAMGVLDRDFVVHRDGDRITGSLWTAAEGEGPAPLVLMGHGGRSESRNEAAVAMARRFVRRHGIAVAAIDAVEHGARGPLTGAEEAPYAELWKRPDTFDRMVADWQATLDAVAALPEVDAGRVAYWGLSMGTMLGLPFVAAQNQPGSATARLWSASSVGSLVARRNRASVDSRSISSLGRQATPSPSRPNIGQFRAIGTGYGRRWVSGRCDPPSGGSARSRGRDGRGRSTGASRGRSRRAGAAPPGRPRPSAPRSDGSSPCRLPR